MMSFRISKLSDKIKEKEKIQIYNQGQNIEIIYMLKMLLN